jgi:outer membrane protein OmpA-like peptidoglycan-associated protein
MSAAHTTARTLSSTTGERLRDFANDTEECRAQNRRIDVRVKGK